MKCVWVSAERIFFQDIRPVCPFVVAQTTPHNTSLQLRSPCLQKYIDCLTLWPWKYALPSFNFSFSYSVGVEELLVRSTQHRYFTLHTLLYVLMDILYPVHCFSWIKCRILLFYWNVEFFKIFYI